MRVVGLLTLALVFGPSLHAQAPTPGQPTTQTPIAPRTPPRAPKPGEPPPKGTAVIKGQVRDAATGTPVRRVQVRASSMSGPGSAVTNTDAEGNFEIRDLMAGRYSLSAVKSGFVQGFYGQKRPGEMGTPIELGEGQTAAQVNFTLTRGGVISGRILDDAGEPVAGATVQATRYQFVSGGRRLVPAASEGSTDRTDDQGSFRLYGLPAGDFYVSANYRQVAFLSGPNENRADAEAFAPTYFPGTANIVEAARVTVKAGQEMSGASFALIVARMARVRGRAVNSSGQPLAGGALMLMPADAAASIAMSMNMSNAMIAADGTFQFVNVPPGRYNINLRPSGMQTTTNELAVVPITVGNEDLDNLIVSTAPAATARGVISTDEGTTPPFRPEQVAIYPGPMEPGPMFMSPGQTRINDDYTFEITGLIDRRLLRANIAQSSDWYLKSIMHDGNDVTDSGMEFEPGRSYDGLHVVFTRKTTDLSGRLTDDRSNPVLDAFVVIFPVDQQKWTPQSRYIRTLRPDTNGRFTVKNLPPLDDYLIIAVQNLESGQAFDPDFLARAREDARPLSLAEGETKSVDVKLSKLVP